MCRSSILQLGKYAQTYTLQLISWIQCVLYNKVMVLPVAQMGGGELKVPDWRIYKVADAPQLVQVERALASHGLRDPWLRLVLLM